MRILCIWDGIAGLSGISIKTLSLDGLVMGVLTARGLRAITLSVSKTSIKGRFTLCVFKSLCFTETGQVIFTNNLLFNVIFFLLKEFFIHI